MSKLRELSNIGQAVWLDFIRRSFLEENKLKELVERGLRGVTSNPSIFKNAIADSNDYDEDLFALAGAGKSTMEIYEALAIKDIRRAADDLRPVYEETAGRDGFVSLEVNPNLAHRTEETIAEAKRLFETVDRPNLMVKVPATPAGIPAIKALIGAGVNINVTLIFSLESYGDVAEAFIAGLEQLGKNGPTVKGGHKVNRVASVASFFVSRVDGATDKALEEAGNKDLQGKIAIANAKLAYRDYQKFFSGGRWDKLAAQGAVAQRVLWASTSTKNPAYPDTLYVDELIGAHTVNTLPPKTLDQFVDHGVVALTLDKGVAEAEEQIAHLAKIGVDFEAITQKLQDDGVASFARAFEELIESVDEKKNGIKAGKLTILSNLGPAEPAIRRQLTEFEQTKVYDRIWEHDHTVWKDDPAEISNRLGWLHSPRVMQPAINDIYALVEEVRAAGFTHALLLGMGGSSLAPEVFRFSFGVGDGYLDLAVLDSTDPGTVLDRQKRSDLSKTLFIVSTKSGGTVETLSFAKYFYRQVAENGSDDPGSQFVAITDPDSGLEALAKQLNFRKIFRNDPDIGGRYSALSYFGLVPAAMVGVDLQRLLESAAMMTADAGKGGHIKATESTSALLGAAIGQMAVSGRDKLSLVISPQIRAVGDWIEQLVAESTGKEGKGILPVVGENISNPQHFANDRLFVCIKLADDKTYDNDLAALADAGHPVIVLQWQDLYDIGGEFFRWEMATVLASIPLDINPFDQPNVEAAKIVARKMVKAYHDSGKLPDLDGARNIDGLTLYGAVGNPSNLKDALSNFLEGIEDGTRSPRPYVCIQAYLDGNQKLDQALQSLRQEITRKYQVAVTVGYGPRFLHSTGQLHKGDAGNGRFIQFLADVTEDVAIPDEAGSDQSSMTFAVLKEAQSLGDRQALLDAGRSVLRIDMGDDPAATIALLAKQV